jgi:hypothetical protein
MLVIENEKEIGMPEYTARQVVVPRYRRAGVWQHGQNNVKGLTFNVFCSSP